MSGAVQADPAARRRRRDNGAWRLWLGWAAAACFHGGLLAALILSRPAHLNPVPNAAAISLLILPASQAVSPAASLPAVRPKPVAEKAVLPPVATVKIPDTRIVRKAAPLPAAPPAAVARPHISVAAPGAVTSRTIPQQDGDGFVAAQPAAGSANQPPEYPLQAQQHGEQGDVLLSIHVLPNGTADSVSVTQSSGYAILDAAAARAVWKWRFQPSTLAGQPVPSVIPYRIHFSLQNLP